jgi:hypothetical protein
MTFMFVPEPRMTAPRLFVLAALAAACGETDDPPDPIPVDIPDTYAFPSRGDASVDSVAYDGQVARHVLLGALERHLSGLTGRLNTGFFPEPGDVGAELDFYFAFDSETSGGLPHGLSTSPPAAQVTFDDVSKGKDLVGKLAGNDPSTDHRDWSVAFAGWGAPGSTTPEGLVRSWFDVVDAQAVAWANGQVPLDPSGAPVPAVTVTPEGLDMRQLIAKVIGVGVAFSQGADDYLDDDVDGKGLLADHTALVDGKPYTDLEHQWDEGFGYFGASRDYALRTLDQISDGPAHDTNGDGAIDLQSEYSFGHSGNAAKRDRGALVSHDFVGDAWNGFAGGRQLLAQTTGPLTDDELDALRGFRDRAVRGWEGAIAATALHYINDTLQDMSKIGTQGYSFADHAKHWSELKGFAIGLQFNRRSPLSQTEFQRLHTLIGDAPVLADASQAERDAYAAKLRDARQLLLDAYGFDPANLGEDDGSNGW